MQRLHRSSYASKERVTIKVAERHGTNQTPQQNERSNQAVTRCAFSFGSLWGVEPVSSPFCSSRTQVGLSIIKIGWNTCSPSSQSTVPATKSVLRSKTQRHKMLHHLAGCQGDSQQAVPIWRSPTTPDLSTLRLVKAKGLSCLINDHLCLLHVIPHTSSLKHTNFNT